VRPDTSALLTCTFSGLHNLMNRNMRINYRHSFYLVEFFRCSHRLRLCRRLKPMTPRKTTSFGIDCGIQSLTIIDRFVVLLYSPVRGFLKRLKSVHPSLSLAFMSRFLPLSCSCLRGSGSPSCWCAARFPHKRRSCIFRQRSWNRPGFSKGINPISQIFVPWKVVLESERPHELLNRHAHPQEVPNESCFFVFRATSINYHL